MALFGSIKKKVKKLAGIGNKATGGLAGGLLGTLTGGLLGGQDMPNMRSAKKAPESLLDPNYGAQVAAAKRRKLAAAGASGRSAMRIDLSSGVASDSQTRSGITIG